MSSTSRGYIQVKKYAVSGFILDLEKEMSKSFMDEVEDIMSNDNNSGRVYYEFDNKVDRDKSRDELENKGYKTNVSTVTYMKSLNPNYSDVLVNEEDE